MTDTELKSLIRELLQPVYDAFVDTTYIFTKSIVNNLPTSMPLEEQKRLVKDVLKTHSDTVIGAFSKQVPTDFAEKLKGAMKNGK